MHQYYVQKLHWAVLAQHSNGLPVITAVCPLPPLNEFIVSWQNTVGEIKPASVPTSSKKATAWGLHNLIWKKGKKKMSFSSCLPQRLLVMELVTTWTLTRREEGVILSSSKSSYFQADKHKSLTRTSHYKRQSNRHLWQLCRKGSAEFHFSNILKYITFLKWGPSMFKS